jgi:hypothetical protein
MAEIRKLQCQNACENQRVSGRRCRIVGAVAGAEAGDSFVGSKIYTPSRLLAAISSFCRFVGARQVGAVELTTASLGQFACAGAYADAVTPGVVYRGGHVRIERVQPRRGVLAATIDMLAAVLAASS